MTRNRSFKRLVRTRMARTGESYTAARAVLLAAREPEPAPDSAINSAPAATPAAPVLATSDERIRERTGRGWEEWFDLLDEAGMGGRPHREVARWVAELLGVVPLAWPAQAVTGSYERARGGRAVGQHADGFTVSASRTLAVAPERVFDAFVDADARAGWLPGVVLRARTATRPRSARFDRGDDGTRVHVTVVPKGGDRCTVTVSHSRLPDADEAARAKQWWRERLVVLVGRLAGGAPDA
ncbi:hypothetical protein [Pseudonocardia lacus]|uniref:hypothetical protein n=1 Tax=Pseudonocardia lacus TaxID=2835865 RepID=UPI001BDC1E7A|nr:hypothetical protein [Pseudonocardia lacus]